MPKYLHIFVNGRKFDASDGVQEFMDGVEIADLVGILKWQVNSPSALLHHHPRQAQSHPDAKRRAGDKKEHDENQHHHRRDLGVMQRVIKNQQNHQRRHDRNQAISCLRQRETSMPVVAHDADKKNHHGKQE
jgi:G3E family GTPase